MAVPPRGIPGIKSKIAVADARIARLDARIRELYGQRRHWRGVKRGLIMALSELIGPLNPRQKSTAKTRVRGGDNKTRLFSALLAARDGRLVKGVLQGEVGAASAVFEALISRHVGYGFLRDAGGFIELTAAGSAHATDMFAIDNTSE